MTISAAAEKQMALIYAYQNHLNPSVFAAQINQESGWNPNAVSSAGAQGLGQLMPATQAQYGVTNPFDPAQSLSAAAQDDAALYKATGSTSGMLAAYNEGLAGYQSGAMPAQTSAYVKAIEANAGVSGASAATPTASSVSSASSAAPTASTGSDKVLVSLFGYNLLTTYGLFDLAAVILGFILVAMAFAYGGSKSSNSSTAPISHVKDAVKDAAEVAVET